MTNSIIIVLYLLKRKKKNTRKMRTDISPLVLATWDYCEPGQCNGSSSLTAWLILEPTWKHTSAWIYVPIPETFDWGEKSDPECSDTIPWLGSFTWIKRKKAENRHLSLSSSCCGCGGPAITNSFLTMMDCEPEQTQPPLTCLWWVLHQSHGKLN